MSISKTFSVDVRRSLPALRVWLPSLLLLTVAAIVFIDLAGDVWLNDGFAWDAPLMLAVHRFGSPGLDGTMIAITQLGTYGAVLVAVSVSAWLWRTKDRLHVWTLVFSFVGAVVINLALKALFARPRPTVFPPLMVEHSYSFPSGHTIGAVGLYGFLALLLWHNRYWLRGILVGLVIPLVALSRVYLGVHYPSDVLGALAVGTLWLAVVWLVHLRFHRRADAAGVSSCLRSPIV